jgi:hypothetical protein
MVLIAPVIAVKDLNVADHAADATLLQAWITGIAMDTLIGWNVEPISNSRLRYTMVYEPSGGP